MRQADARSAGCTIKTRRRTRQQTKTVTHRLLLRGLVVLVLLLLRRARARGRGRVPPRDGSRGAWRWRWRWWRRLRGSFNPAAALAPASSRHRDQASSGLWIAQGEDRVAVTVAPERAGGGVPGVGALVVPQVWAAASASLVGAFLFR